ncbi:hypothetical protein N566_11135 [Streptomycetaceae bacterium MP113-05]|nr:hypothetical protein N566_11135 [Streptomycetaceae bacterium MP113-05]
MTAHAHLSTARVRPAPAQRAVRLPWWALALPGLVFCALLTLMLAGGDAEAAQRGVEPLARLLERLQQVLA